MDNARMKNEESRVDRFGIAERTQRRFGDVAESRAGGKKIFLSARYGRKEELRGYAEELAALGHAVTSSWVYRQDEADDDSLSFVAARGLALADLIQIYNSDVFIAFTEQPESPYGRGGRHVEFGFAMFGYGEGLLKAIIAVGPRENVFHALPEVHQINSWLLPDIKLILRTIEGPSGGKENGR